MGGQWGIDAVMQLFTQDLKTYVPTVPLLYAVGACSDSSAKKPGEGCDLDKKDFLENRLKRLIREWPQGYILTYCESKGKIRPGHRPLAKYPREACMNVTSSTCCPYKDPPRAPV